ncbi:MAG: hypothetical protein JNG89_18655 [Planctomycetaceae bacterium]|nr:hypothetical protein [Planctomycetaceae bacterium]
MEHISKVRFNRKRVAVALVLLLILGTVIGWKLAHRHDPRLLGQWKASPAPTYVISIFAEWEFLDDGTGQRSGKLRPDEAAESLVTSTPVSQQPATGSVAKQRVAVVHMRGRFHWWTRGDRLYVQLLTSRSLWMRARESTREAFNSITGQPVMRVTNPVWEYRFAVGEDDRIQITPVSVPAPADNMVFELTRLEGRTP